MITVVIPLFNKEKYVERTIGSVMAQDLQCFEAIVIDDGSTDNSFSIVSELTQNDKRFKIIQIENSGVSVARNVGVTNASYDYVAFLDADDTWEPSHLSSILKLINDFPLANIYANRYSLLANDGGIRVPRISLPSDYRGYVDNLIGEYNKGYGLLHTSCICVEVRKFLEIGGFEPNEKKSQDVHLWLKFGIWGQLAVSPLYTSYKHLDSLGTARRKEQLPCHIKLFSGQALELTKENKYLREFLTKSVFVNAYFALKNRDRELVNKLRFSVWAFNKSAYVLLSLVSFIPSGIFLFIVKRVEKMLRISKN